MRSRFGLAAILAFAAIARVLSAQGGGDKGAVNKPPAIDSEKLAEAKRMDLENPIPFILSHAGKLKLTADQSTRMASLQGELTRENQDLSDRIDSIQPPGTGRHVGFATLTPAQRDSILQARKAMADTRGQMHDNSRKTREAALALMTPDQQNALTAIEQDMRNTMQDAVYGSRNGDGGAPQRSRGGGGASPY
jgi:hypothetical protein